MPTRGNAHSATTPLPKPSVGRYGDYALTVPQVSLRLGIAEYTIRREIRAGRLRAVKHKRWIVKPAPDRFPISRWLILWRDVEAWWSVRAGESLVPQQRGVDRRRARLREAVIAVSDGDHPGTGGECCRT